MTRPFKIEYIELACYDEVVELIPEEIKNRNNYIFATEPNLETSGLKIVLWIAMISLGLEIIMMFHKNHFYTLLTLCSVLSIFFLNYFDSTFIKIVIANLLLSSVLDMIWEITNARVSLTIILELLGRGRLFPHFRTPISLFKVYCHLCGLSSSGQINDAGNTI